MDVYVTAPTTRKSSSLYLILISNCRLFVVKLTLGLHFSIIFCFLYVDTYFSFNICRLEHVDELLRSARLSGYLYIRTVMTIFTYLHLFILLYFLHLTILIDDLPVNST